MKGRTGYSSRRIWSDNGEQRPGEGRVPHMLQARVQVEHGEAPKGVRQEETGEDAQGDKSRGVPPKQGHYPPKTAGKAHARPVSAPRRYIIVNTCNIVLFCFNT